MKKENRDIVRILFIALVAMFALPAAYRVWLHYNPQPERKPFAEMLREAGGLRRETLLTTPLDRWSARDATLAPDVREWLVNHAEVILPWEWAEEAKKKDWKGYCKLWERIVEEQISALDSLIAYKSSVIGDTADKARIERAMATHDLEQAEKARAAATNSYPVIFETDELTPGRLWGWNHRRKRRSFDDEGALMAYTRELEERAKREWSVAAEAHEREGASAKSDVAALTATRDGFASALKDIEEARKSGYVFGALEKALRHALLDSIGSMYRCKAPERGGASRWLPASMRKWFSSPDEVKSSPEGVCL